MLEELNHVLMLWEILSFYLPAVAAGVIVVVTLLLVCRDRRRRSLALEAPPESRRIAALAESGLVSPEEARRLLAECNALPEVRETAPVPDLPLRLVSAFGRIFGVMKLVLYLGRIGALGILRLMAQSSNYVRGIDAELEDGRLFFALSAFLVLVSVLELAASVRLLRGSLAARNLLVFCWIADFVLLMTAYAGYDSLYYALPAAACGIYSLHVLVFRRDAVRRIAVRGPEPGRGAKSAVAGIAAAALLFGIFGLPLLNPELEGMKPVMSLVSTGIGGPAQIRCQKILLIAGTPDAETAEFCSLLAPLLTADAGIPCEIRRFDGPVPLDDHLRELPFMVSRVKCLPGLGGGWSGVSLISPGRGANVTETLGKLLARVRQPIAFRVELLDGRTSAGLNFHGLAVEEGCLSFDGTFVAASGPGARNLSLRNAAPRAARAMRILWEAQREKPTVRLPAAALPEPLPFEPESLPEDFRLCYRGRSIHYGLFAVYRFPAGEPGRDEERVTAFLRPLGFEKEPHSWYDGTLQYRRKDGSAVLLSLRHPVRFRELGTVAEFNQMTVKLRAPRTEWNAAESAAFRARLLADDPRSFANANGLRLLEGDELVAAFDRAVGPELSLEEKLLIFDSVGEAEPQKTLAGRGDALYAEILDGLAAEFNTERFICDLDRLLDIVRGQPERREALERRFPGVFHRVALPEKPDAGGARSSELVIEPGRLAPVHVILETEVPGGGPALEFAFSLVRQSNGRYALRAGSVCRNGITSGKLAEEHYWTLKRESAAGEGRWMTGSSGCGLRRASGGMREPGTLFCGMTVDPGPDRFRFHIVYTDKAEEEE